MSAITSTDRLSAGRRLRDDDEGGGAWECLIGCDEPGTDLQRSRCDPPVVVVNRVHQRVTVPTLVIHGDGDAIVRFAGSGQRTHAVIAGSELLVLEGARTAATSATPTPSTAHSWRFWRTSEAKKNRILELYAIADGRRKARRG